MTFIILSIALLFFVIVVVHKNNEKDRKIKELISQLEDLDGKLPCYAPCFICRITEKPCVGRKTCKLYRKISINGRDERI